MENLRKYILDRTEMGPDEAAHVSSVFTTKLLRKHQSLLQQGDICRNHAFVSKGCLRTYTIDEKGTEHAISFAVENWWPGDCESLMSGTPSSYNIDALEDSKVLLISNDRLAALCTEFPRLGTMFSNMYIKGFMAAQERINVFLESTAEEKYRYFVKKYPQIPNRVPLNMIASYLGMSPETVSRIRRSLVKMPQL